MTPRELLEEPHATITTLTFELSQREGEIAILRQRLATVEAERDLLGKAHTACRSTLRSIEWLIRHQLNQ